jgi:hypothetical protein
LKHKRFAKKKRVFGEIENQCEEAEKKGKKNQKEKKLCVVLSLRFFYGGCAVCENDKYTSRKKVEKKIIFGTRQ